MGLCQTFGLFAILVSLRHAAFGRALSAIDDNVASGANFSGWFLQQSADRRSSAPAERDGTPSFLEYVLGPDPSEKSASSSKAWNLTNSLPVDNRPAHTSSCNETGCPLSHNSTGTIGATLPPDADNEVASRRWMTNINESIPTTELPITVSNDSKTSNFLITRTLNSTSDFFELDKSGESESARRFFWAKEDESIAKNATELTGESAELSRRIDQETGTTIWGDSTTLNITTAEASQVEYLGRKVVTNVTTWENDTVGFNSTNSVGSTEVKDDVSPLNLTGLDSAGQTKSGQNQEGRQTAYANSSQASTSATSSQQAISRSSQGDRTSTPRQTKAESSDTALPERQGAETSTEDPKPGPDSTNWDDIHAEGDEAQGKENTAAEVDFPPPNEKSQRVTQDSQDEWHDSSTQHDVTESWETASDEDLLPLKGDSTTRRHTVETTTRKGRGGLWSGRFEVYTN